MSLIDVTNLTFAYEGSYDNIFENVSFQIDTNWKLGMTGRNGRGKTTFLKLLMNVYEYQGSISASVNFDYFPVEIADMTQNTIDIAEKILGEFDFWKLQRELSMLDVEEETLYRPFGTLSSGERTKILLACLFIKDNNFLLIDEPTNHLDIAARKRVSEYLNTKKGFILISHDRNFLDNCIDHLLSINRANIEVQKGNFSTWYDNKQMQDKYEMERNETLKKDIKRLEQSAKQASSWSNKVEDSKIGSHAGDRGYIGHMAAKMMKRSKSIEKRREKELDEKSKLLKNIEKADSLTLYTLEHHTDKLLSIENVSVSYDGKEVCGGVSFEVRQGSRVALQGKNGSGKSSILKLICGDDVEYTGKLITASGLKISYVPQDASYLCGNLRDFANEHNLDESLFKAVLRKLDLSPVQFDKNISDYSAGQKKKVLIAKSLCTRAHLYIWDEPLNYIDVLSRIQIEDLITEYRPTLLFVEHDSAFIERIATHVITL